MFEYTVVYTYLHICEYIYIINKSAFDFLTQNYSELGFSTLKLINHWGKKCF